MEDTKFTSYALLGSGRVARHLREYLRQLELPHVNWSRNGDPAFNSHPLVSDSLLRLEQTLSGVSHVLIAVKDSAVAELAQLKRPEQVGVHFSGALSLAEVGNAHPLMTFGEQLQSLEWYQSVPFIIDEDRDFRQLLPGLPNPHFPIAREKRALYHALCSLAGNSTFLLWKLIGDEFERSLDLPRGLLSPYLHQVVNNSKTFNPNNFTGPVARGDWDVVRAHMNSLFHEPSLSEAYRTYLKLASGTGLQLPEELS